MPKSPPFGVGFFVSILTYIAIPTPCRISPELPLHTPMDIVLDLPDLDASLNWFFAPSHQRTMRRRGLHIKRIDIARKQIVIGGEDEDVEAVVDEIEAERAR